MIWEEDARGGQAGVAGLDACAEAEARRLLAAAFETVPVRPGLAASLTASIGRNGPTAPDGDVVSLVRDCVGRARRRRVLVSAGAIGLAAAVAGAVMVGVLTDSGTASPTALQAVTAAVIKTSSQSFTFKETNDLGRNAPHQRLARSGEFNPANGTGEEQIYLPFGRVQQNRYIGRYAYIRTGTLTNGKPWERWLWTGGSTSAAAIALGDGADGAINPADLFTLLKGVSSVHGEGPASGPGWTGTSYGFTVNLPKSFPDTTMSGTVSVDSSGRVRKLATVTHHTGRRKETYTDIVTFGDFGVAVSVTAPPASQVYIGD